MQLNDSSQEQLAISLLLFVICCSCSVFATRSIDVLLNELLISLDLYQIITYFLINSEESAAVLIILMRKSMIGNFVYCSYIYILYLYFCLCIAVLKNFHNAYLLIIIASNIIHII